MIRAVGSPRRARTVLAVPAHWSSRPAPRSRRARNHGARQTLRHRASSSANSFVRGRWPLALRTSSWWMKNSLRFGKRRTHPMRKKPGGGPDRIIAMRSAKCLVASAFLRASVKCAHGPGRTSPGPAMGSCSRRTRCAARSRVVHGCRRVGASGPSSSKRSLSCARSTASKSGSSTSPKRSDPVSLEDEPVAIGRRWQERLVWRQLETAQRDHRRAGSLHLTHATPPASSRGGLGYR